MILVLSVVVGLVSVILLNSLNSPYAHSLFGGLAIISSGYILSVAVESAQKDVPRSFATVILALIAILPEYAVDIYLAYTGAKDPAFIHYATANMTGANRMLLGLFWPVIAFVSIYISLNDKAVRDGAVLLGKGFRLELFFLFIASLYSFKIPLTGRIDLFDSIFLISLFFLYAYVSAKSEEKEEEFEGIVERITRMKKYIRVPTVISMFLVAGVYIFLSVELFTHGLIETGKLLGINEFLLIQWIAPIASEFPELVVAIILAMKGKSTVAIGALVSSKVNQWTLLVGALPLAYSFGLSRFSSMPLDALQREEIFLTAAQSLFGTIIIADLRISRFDAFLLFILFITQFIIPIPTIRLIIAFIYIALSLVMILKDRINIFHILSFYKNILR